MPVSVQSASSSSVFSTQDKVPSQAAEEEKGRDGSNMADKAQAMVLKERGNVCFKKGMLQSALEMYTQAIGIDSSCPVYYTNRALCYKKLGKWEQALEDSKQALKLEKDNVKAHFLVGEALLQLGRLGGARWAGSGRPCNAAHVTCDNARGVAAARSFTFSRESSPSVLVLLT